VMIICISFFHISIVQAEAHTQTGYIHSISHPSSSSISNEDGVIPFIVVANRIVSDNEIECEKKKKRVRKSARRLRRGLLRAFRFPWDLALLK